MAKFVKTPENTPAGYQPPSEGPFKCSHCEYYRDGLCSKDQVIEELGAAEGEELAAVSPNGCCNFYESIGQTVQRRSR